MEDFSGQPVLFRDSVVKLKEQLRMAEKLSDHFNFLAREVGAEAINLEEHRESLQSGIERQAAIWINLARVAALGAFGTDEQMHAAADQYALFFEPRAQERQDATDA